MRHLVISDIHANLVALEAVLDTAPDFAEVWCLGDLVGYGPWPNECIERIREFPHVSLLGNHDCAALGRLDLSMFNSDARIANEWTQARLTDDSLDYLGSLPAITEHGGFTLAHGSPREPIWEYILGEYQALANGAYFHTPVCLVGHTHIPAVFDLGVNGEGGGTVMGPSSKPVNLTSRRLIINPGSVGQPRDGDPRASYAVLDTDSMTWEFHRVTYQVERTQKQMMALGLPSRLIQRLSVGK
jgi:diadenosine tetraphosphatase ApaH/serine/threonine PP2A family protein phosphatase